MKARRIGLWLLISMTSMLWMACYGEPPSTTSLGSLTVKLAEGTKLGTVKAPLDVPVNTISYKLLITPYGPDGKPDTKFDGQVCIFVNRGILVDGHKPFPVKGGTTTEVNIRLKLAFGKTTFWAAEAAKPGSKTDKCPNSADPTDITKPYVGRAGAAEDIYFKNLSIRDVQTSSISPYDSPLYKKYAYISSGRMVVTGVTSNGFYATDLDVFEDGKGFHSMFIFTFSAPTLAYADGVVPRSLQIGELIKKVEGGIDEFSGHTQVTFPSFTPDWVDEKKGIAKTVKPADMPKPIPIVLEDTWNRRKMEPLESALVEIKDAIAVPFDLNQVGWSQFRQWPVLLVKAKKPSDQTMCEELVKTELFLHVDASKNKGSSYRQCLTNCYTPFKEATDKCDPTDQECLDKATDGWFGCFFQTCRFDRENGVFARFTKAGCEHAMLLVISNSTVPGYDPARPDHLKRRFPSIKGILLQSRASGFYKLSDTQYDNEQSNNGYVIWVRNPDDLTLPKE